MGMARHSAHNMPKLDKQTMGREHIVAINGNMLGFNAIDIGAAHTHYDYWDGIDEIIRAYAHLNPAEMAATLADNKMQRDNAINATGANQSGTQRSTIGIPFGLMLYLEEYDAELFTNKRTLHEFMRRYLGLRTCRTV